MRELCFVQLALALLPIDCVEAPLKYIVRVGADISFEGVGFLAYRLERAREPKAHEERLSILHSIR